MENCPMDLLNSINNRVETHITSCADKKTTLETAITDASAKSASLSTDASTLDEGEQAVVADWVEQFGADAETLSAAFLGYKQETYAPFIATQEEIVSTSTAHKDGYEVACAPLDGQKTSVEDLIAQFEAFQTTAGELNTGVEATILAFNEVENPAPAESTEDAAAEEGTTDEGTLVDDASTDTATDEAVA